MEVTSHKLRVGLAVLATAGILGPAGAQTPTQPSPPGQSKTSGTSTQMPATTTQPGIAPAAAPDTLSAGQSSSAQTSQSTGSLLSGGTKTPTPVLVPGQAVTLEQALALAQVNEPLFSTAAATAEVAQLNTSIAKAALLPSAVYHNQYLFTEGNHLPGAAVPQVFIANNAIHEYVSQGLVTETIGAREFNAVAQANTAAVIANAGLEVSRRGLTATVIGLYYAAFVAQGRIDIQQSAVNEASDFFRQTSEREAAREIAHADVLKSQLTLQQRQRDLIDARLASDKARLSLGVLLYPDPRTSYTVALPEIRPLPTRAEADAAAGNKNPELASALATFKASQLGVSAARAAYLPNIMLNYAYGIDAPQFAANGPEGERFLGYSASVTVDVPIWDWLSTQRKVKQARILRDAAKVTMTNTQRRFIANLETFYDEMRVAHDQLDSLQRTVQDARESLRLTRLRYGNGEGTVLEVVDAQNTLTTSELALQDGTVRYQLALANLQTLTGNF